MKASKDMHIIISHTLKSTLFFFFFFTSTISKGEKIISTNYEDSISVLYEVKGELIESGVKRKRSDFFGFTIIAYEVAKDNSGNELLVVTSESQKVTTDKKGSFSFTLSSRKKYLLKCVKPGYISDEIPLPKRNIAKGQSISLEIQVKKANTAVLTGYVLSDIDGALLKEAVVTVEQAEQGVKRNIVTEKDGSYTFEIVEGNHYRLSAKKEMFVPSNLFKVNYEMASGGILRRNFNLKSKGLGKVYRLSGFYFEVNDYTVNKKQASALSEAVTIIKKNPDYQFEVACYSDARGDDAYNLSLTEARANSIVNYLIKKYKILPERLIPKGYGESRLINECSNDVYCSTEKHAENRRIELRVIKKSE